MSYRLKPPKSIRCCAFGELGTGKTLSLMYEANKWRNAHPGITVYSNIPIAWPHIEIRDLDTILYIKRDSLVILDELWHIANSRKSSSIKNEIMTMILMRSRKRHWFVGYTEQDWIQTDKWIRFVTELWIEPYTYDDEHFQLQYFTKKGKYIGERTISGPKYWDLFKSEEDPYTLDETQIAEKWEKYKKSLR